MNILLIFILFLNKFNCLPEISKKIIENENGVLKGTFKINSIYKKNAFISCDNDKLIISQKRGNFDLLKQPRIIFIQFVENQRKLLVWMKEKVKNMFCIQTYIRIIAT